MRMRMDVVTVLCVFKVHFASVFSFLLVSRIYSHVFPARHCAPPLPRAAYGPIRPPGTKPQQPAYPTAPPGSVYGGVDAPRICPTWAHRGPDRAAQSGLAEFHRGSAIPPGRLRSGTTAENQTATTSTPYRPPRAPFMVASMPLGYARFGHPSSRAGTRRSERIGGLSLPLVWLLRRLVTPYVRSHRNNNRLSGLPAIPAPFMGESGYLGCGCFWVGWA